MNKIVSTMFAGLIGIGTALTSVAPLQAAPVVPAPMVEKSTDVQQIQDRRYYRRGDWRRGDWRGRRGWDGRRGYYRGHRGYRYYRPGYRRHGDFWFPAGAFIAGALIGSALDDGPRYAPRRVYRGGGSAHVQWCYNRYRSYDAGSNTYQPYDGPRRQCWSPYS